MEAQDLPRAPEKAPFWNCSGRLKANHDDFNVRIKFKCVHRWIIDKIPIGGGKAIPPSFFQFSSMEEPINCIIETEVRFLQLKQNTTWQQPTKPYNKQMPTYQHICSAPECQHQWEDIYSIVQDPPTKCPKCGAETAVRQVSGGVGFLLQGGGWFADSYSKK